MSTIDRNDFAGKPSRRKPLMDGDYAPPTDFPELVRERAAEARKGGAQIRHKAWIDHDYDCTKGLWGSGRKVKHPQMESCSLLAADFWYQWNGRERQLWGERPKGQKKWKEGRFSYSVTDGHW